MTDISNTGYTIQNNQIHDPDGNAISQDQFLNQVESKKIALTGTALTVLGESFGTEYANKLAQTKGANTETLSQVNDKLAKDSNTSGDITLQILELIHKSEQTQKQAQRELANATVQLQKEKINEQADKMKAAAVTQLATGLVSAGIQFTAGAVSVKGGIKAGKMTNTGAAQAQATITTGKTGMINALASAVGAVGQGVSGFQTADAKRTEGEQAEIAHHADEAKKAKDNADETEKKARDTLQAVIQARDQAMSKAVNMS